jgi:uncharacterized protein
MDDRDRVRELLGREPRGDFEVVVRDERGDPVVLRNAPLLHDGTPMPTRYWLCAPDLVRDVSRLEAAGGVRAAEQQIDPARIAAAHDRYAAERDAAIPAEHRGPRPTGGVGGTRAGVKCLHAHYAWRLAGGDDPVGAWVDEQLSRGAAVRLELNDRATIVRHGRRWAEVMPVGVRSLTENMLDGHDPPQPEQLTNALGSVVDHLDDVVLSHPDVVGHDVVIGGDPARTFARVEAGLDDVPDEFVIRRDAAEEVFRTLATENRRDRATNPGLSPDEVDTVLAASCIVVATMRHLQLDHVTVG